MSQFLGNIELLYKLAQLCLCWQAVGTWYIIFNVVRCSESALSCDLEYYRVKSESKSKKNTVLGRLKIAVNRGTSPLDLGAELQGVCFEG